MAFHNQLSQEMALQHFTEQHLSENASVLRTILPNQLSQSSPEGAGKAPENRHQPLQLGTGPTWLNHAIQLRQQSQYSDNNFLNFLQRNTNDVVAAGDEVSNDSIIATAMSHESADLANNNSNNSNVKVNNSGNGAEIAESGDGAVNWQNARHKAEILGHPLYEQLLSAHVACLRIATPVDQLPRIDAQLAQSQHVVSKYSALGHGNSQMLGDEKELDQFMTHYVLLLCSFKEQLQQHVRVHAMEAVMACWEIEQSLQSLTALQIPANLFLKGHLSRFLEAKLHASILCEINTASAKLANSNGVSPGEGTGATMSDDEEDQIDSDANLFDGSLEGADSMGFGPLVPTESERSLMERVRQELKHELKQGYKEKIVDIREEILRKRRAGKLPGDTTSVLKSWWQSHSKWPYPTEEDKAKLVQETGLQLKQINNWFINQRKRNWHSNPSTSTVLKSKRKR